MAVGANLALGGVPHVPDEASYLMQARLFADGLRVGPAGLAPDLADWPLWQAEPAASVFPIGWSLLLAPAAGLGLERWMNPLLAGLLPVFGWLALRERLSEKEARLSAAVLALTPGVSVLAASQMAHTSVLVALTGALAVGLRDRDGPGVRVLAGLALGYVVLARPFDATLLAGPLALWMAWRQPRKAWTLAPVAVAGVLALADNAWMTGDPLSFPASVYLEVERPGCNGLGFGPEIGCDPTLGDFGHSPTKAAIIAALSLERMERLILGIPGGGLLFVAGLALGRKRLLWLAPSLLVPMLGYALYWTPGAAYGARFYHPGMLFVAAAVGVALARVRVLPVVFALAAMTGQALVWKSLGTYFCADPALANAVTGLEGVVVLQRRGERTDHNGPLRLTMPCSSGMGHGPLMSKHDPTGVGLQILRMPEGPDRYNQLLEDVPGPIWVLDYAVGKQEIEVFQVK